MAGLMAVVAVIEDVGMTAVVQMESEAVQMEPRAPVLMKILSWLFCDGVFLALRESEPQALVNE